MLKKKLKKIILVINFFVLSLFLVYFFFRYAYQPRASTAKVTFNFNQEKVTFSPEEERIINFTLQSEDPQKYRISGVNLNFKFDINNKDLLDFIDYSASSIASTDESYFTDTIIKQVSKTNEDGGSKTLRIVAVTRKPDKQLSGILFFNLRFKAKKNSDSNKIMLNSSISRVVGITGVENSFFDLKTSRGEINYDLISRSQTPTNQPPQSGNVNLNLKIKFQGITQKPQDQFNTLKVRVIAISGSSQDNKEVDFKAKDINDTKKGIWEGIVTLNLKPGNDYRILIKGPKHIKKRICDPSPYESFPGTYTCNQGKISLNPGNNDLDFSNIILLVGDLPNQDGVVNAYDLALVRNNLGKDDSEALRLADLNLDGKVNTQDYSLIMAALSVRNDEE